MAPEIQGVVRATQTWLRSSWHVQVPFAWLEACVQWLQEEGGGVGRLSQQHINQQVLDQWLLTDLRDLDHPVLPEGLSQAQKTELSGTFCVQVDSLLDISQPAYGQLQKWRGTDCTNDEVSAVTQTTQRPWEAKPNRMLLLQVTDGVQSLEAMEYQPIPALSTALRPGVKLQLQGQIVCRLGVLLLGPTNVKVLGGEVEDLVDRNSQGRVLCRALGLPEEEQQDGEEGPAALPEGNQEAENLEPDDQELLASLEAQEDVERVQVGTNLESGYGTLSETSSRSSSVRSHVSTASSRSQVSTPSYRSGSVQNNRGGSVQSHRWGNELDDSDLVAPISSSNSTHQDVTDYNMADEDFPEEDFDDLPLDELDSVIFHENTNVTPQPDSSLRSRPQTSNRITANNSFDRATKPQTDRFDRESEQQTLNGSGSRFSRQDKERNESCTKAAKGQLVGVTSKPYLPSASSSSHDGGHFPTDDERHFMDEDMDSCFVNDTEMYGVQTGHESTRGTVQETGQASRAGQPERLQSMCQRPQGLCQSRLGTERVATKSEPSDSNHRLSSQSSGGVTDVISIKTEPAFASSHSTIQGQCAVEKEGLSVRKDPQCDSSTVPALSLTSPPFSYLCLLQEWISKPHQNTIEICVKAFIVTLLGKLTSSNGVWRVCATISDGTGYLDVELSDEVLTGLLGFSVAEKAALKRDPARRGELDTGMKRCQEELVDMCCVMTIVVEPQGRKAVVTRADPVTENMLQALEQRVRDRRK